MSLVKHDAQQEKAEQGHADPTVGNSAPLILQEVLVHKGKTVAAGTTLAVLVCIHDGADFVRAANRGPVGLLLLIIETREDEFRLPRCQQFLADERRLIRYLCQQN